MGKDLGKNILLIAGLSILLLAKFWFYIVPAVIVGLAIWLYPKWSHHELQKKSLDVDIRLKENQITMSQKEMEIKQMELQAQIMDLQSKMNKRGAKTEQIDLTNEVIKRKLGNNQISDYNDQINNLQ